MEAKAGLSLKKHMPNWIQIIKEFSTFFGKKLDHIGVEIKGAEIVTIKGKPGEPGKPGHTPTDAELLAIIKPLIPKVEDGHTPTQTELLALIRPLIPKVKDGETPSDARLSKLIKPLLPVAIQGEPGVNGSPDTPTEIIEKINKEKGTRIRKDKVEGFDELEKLARTAQANISVFHNSGSFVYDYDLSSLLDGVTKTFTLPVNAKVIAVMGSSAPVIYRRTVDFTTTASTITFTSQVDASTTLSAGQTVVILYKIL